MAEDVRDVKINDNQCILICEDVMYIADKNLLIDKSRYFQAMFTSECKESVTSRVVLHNVAPRILYLILKYIEKEEIPQLQGKKEELLAFLSTCDMLSMTELFETCCSQLNSVVTHDNFAEIFSLNRVYHSERFEKELMAYMSMHLRELKRSVVNIFSYEEIKCLLTHEDLIYTKQLCTQVLSFVVQWIKQDINRRHKFLPDLISFMKLSNLADETLELFLTDEVLFETSEIARNALIEKCSVDQINILFHKRKRLKIYNVASDMWIEAKIIPNHQPIINVFHYGNHFYFITFELHEDFCSVFIFRYSGDENLQLLYDVGNIRGKFHVCAIDNLIYIINCEMKDIHSGLFKTIVRYFNILSNEKKVIGEKTFTREITKIASSHTHIYLLSTSRTPFLFIVSFNVASLTWLELSNPPLTPEFYMEHASCCRDKLYIIRFYKTKELVKWDPSGPLNKEDFLKLMEGKECSIKTNDDNLTYEINTSKVTIFCYDHEYNSWSYRETVQHWSYSVGFIHFHNRFLKEIPYMYLLLLNRTIVQINPETHEFKELVSVPDDFYSSLHFPAYYTVFCR